MNNSPVAYALGIGIKLAGIESLQRLIQWCVEAGVLIDTVETFECKDNKEFLRPDLSLFGSSMDPDASTWREAVHRSHTEAERLVEDLTASKQIFVFEAWLSGEA